MNTTTKKLSSSPHSSVLNLSLMGVFAALSVVAIMFIRIPLIPAAPWLVYDMADIPILLISMIISPLSGLCVLAAVCLIQAFLLGGDGIIGFVMHFVASGAMVLILGYIYRKWNKVAPHMIIGAVISTLAMTLIMIPLNLIFTPILFGTPAEAVKQLIVPVLIPFNFLKAGINCAVSLIFFCILKPIYSKILN